MEKFKEINTYSSQHSELNAILKITNKTIFQRTCNKIFQSMFNHKMQNAYINKTQLFWIWNTFQSCKQAAVDNRSSQFILEMVCFLERKIEVVFLQKIFLQFIKHTLWSDWKKALCECYVTIWGHLSQNLDSLNINLYYQLKQ